MGIGLFKAFQPNKIDVLLGGGPALLLGYASYL